MKAHAMWASFFYPENLFYYLFPILRRVDILNTYEHENFLLCRRRFDILRIEVFENEKTPRRRTQPEGCENEKKLLRQTKFDILIVGKSKTRKNPQRPKAFRRVRKREIFNTPKKIRHIKKGRVQRTPETTKQNTKRKDPLQEQGKR